MLLGTSMSQIFGECLGDGRPVWKEELAERTGHAYHSNASRSLSRAPTCAALKPTISADTCLITGDLLHGRQSCPRPTCRYVVLCRLQKDSMARFLQSETGQAVSHSQHIEEKESVSPSQSRRLVLVGMSSCGNCPSFHSLAFVWMSGCRSKSVAESCTYRFVPLNFLNFFSHLKSLRVSS